MSYFTDKIRNIFSTAVFRKGSGFYGLLFLLSLIFILISNMPAGADVSTDTIHPRYNSTYYYFEQGPHPDYPRSPITFNEVKYPGNALIMSETEGSSQVEHLITILVDEQQDSFGVFVSQPLAGGQTIQSTMTWTFHGAFGIQNNATTGNPVVGHRTNARVYLWKRDWADDHYMGTDDTGSGRDDNWIILTNPWSAERYRSRFEPQESRG